MTKSYTLYGRPGSGSLATQVVLEELGVDYERVWVGREPTDVERFQAVNPTGKVPALRLPDGTVMFESAAMLMHLGALDADAKLAPRPGSSRHAVFLQWMTFLSANAYEAALRFFYAPRYSTRGEADAKAVAAQGEIDFAAHLSFIGGVLNPYVLGTDYSVADAYLYMLASWLPGNQELFARVPALGAHAQKVSSRAAVRKVEADHAKHA